MSQIIINTDGGARGNPGPAGAGVVIRKGGAIIAEIKKYLGDDRTNNWAEYEALIIGLTETKRFGLAKGKLEIRMDSELIVRQMQGVYKVKDKNLKLQHAKVRELLGGSRHVTFVHIPREENSEADALVNAAIDEAS